MIRLIVLPVVTDNKVIKIVDYVFNRFVLQLLQWVLSVVVGVVVRVE